MQDLTLDKAWDMQLYNFLSNSLYVWNYIIIDAISMKSLCIIWNNKFCHTNESSIILHLQFNTQLHILTHRSVSHSNPVFLSYHQTLYTYIIFEFHHLCHGNLASYIKFCYLVLYSWISTETWIKFVDSILTSETN